jgi:RNA polymerase sigma-70 factor (ECF subfamily)
MDDFESNIVSHQPKLRQYARRLTRSVDAADDLVQDTYLSALKYRKSYDPGKSALLSWLRMIMVRLHRHERRFAEGRGSLTEKFDSLDDLPDDDNLTPASPDNQHTLLELKDTLKDLNTLSQRQRDAVLDYTGK